MEIYFLLIERQTKRMAKLHPELALARLHPELALARLHLELVLARFPELAKLDREKQQPPVTKKLFMFK